MRDPRQQYNQALEERRAAAARLEARHRKLGNARLLVACAALVIAWIAIFRGTLSGWWLLVPVAAFVALAMVHARVLQAQARAQRAVRFYEAGLARLDDRWMGAGETGERFRNPAHPYADDLDLFGRGSLFELLSAARTPSGEETLASWLCAPAPPAVVRARQDAVTELRSRTGLREDLAVLGEEVRTGVHSEPLARWGEQPPILENGPLRVAAAVIPCIVLASIVVWIASGWQVLYMDVFLVLLLAEQGFARTLRRRIQRVVHDADQPAQDLALLADVLVRLEHEPFSAPRLVELRAALDTEGHPPSYRIARLQRLMELLDSADNVAMRVFGPVLLWRIQLCFAIENWRRHSGPAVRGWLMAVGEMEALSSLAGYAYEHPAGPFPEFVAGSPLFDGRELVHPLLPRSRAVPNDVCLDAASRVLVVSGSNMSGKSTLLRTVGLNAVLAQAGAPVCGAGLRLAPLAVGASIRIMDSLQSGTSRFYAEITRLRAILDLTEGPVPVLFLLDELLHGTNSHDRRIGAEAIVRSLVARGAFGLLTTHDLALAHIAGAPGIHGANVHFEDHLEDGRMRFDYRMRPGVVDKSNALELMRSVGLLGPEAGI